MSNSRIQPQALNAKLSWEIIGLDLAKNDVSFVGITLEGEIIRIDRLTYEQLLEFSKKNRSNHLCYGTVLRVALLDESA